MKRRIICMLLCASLLCGCGTREPAVETVETTTQTTRSVLTYESKLGTTSTTAPAVTVPKSIPVDTLSLSVDKWNKKKKKPYMKVNDNVPFFNDDAKKLKQAFETYSELDALGRCGTAFVNACKEIMPSGEREPINMVKPSGWHNADYGNLIEGESVYNRAHLVAFMLSGESANEKNLITGTRYLNVEGMLPFEIKVGDYIEANPKNHVLYRVTPIFQGNDLVAQGVLMEAWSVEDKGEGICFCVFCFNVQPYIDIDYATGETCLAKDAPVTASSTGGNEADPDPDSYTYVLNTNTKRIHRPDCESVSEMKKKNRAYTDETLEELKSEGYKPCSRCNPV